MTSPKPPFRADHVGRLLRPAALGTLLCSLTEERLIRHERRKPTLVVELAEKVWGRA